VDAAFDHARRFGVSADLIEAMRTYALGLTRVPSSQARHIKRRAALLYLLDPEIRNGEQRCWSHRLRTGLAQLPAEERVHWHALILRMSIHENPRMPKTWQRVVDKFTGRIEVNVVLARLEEWWPGDALRAVPLQSAGSQFLKHAVWMLELIRERTPDAAARCDALVLRLTALDWQPRERAKKVVVVAADYLARRPAEIGWDALLRMAKWSIRVKRSGEERTRTADIAVAFARSHLLTVPADLLLAAAPPVTSPTRRSTVPVATTPAERDTPTPAATTWFGRILAAARRLVS
jgi:hypothetical protein